MATAPMPRPFADPAPVFPVRASPRTEPGRRVRPRRSSSRTDRRPGEWRPPARARAAREACRASSPARASAARRSSRRRTRALRLREFESAPGDPHSPASIDEVAERLQPAFAHETRRILRIPETPGSRTRRPGPTCARLMSSTARESPVATRCVVVECEHDRLEAESREPATRGRLEGERLRSPRRSRSPAREADARR